MGAFRGFDTGNINQGKWKQPDYFSSWEAKGHINSSRQLNNAFLQDLGKAFKSAWLSGGDYLMESVIGEYSSYQAALCAHNLEGHVVALWANTPHTQKMENLASWRLQMSTLRLNFICRRTSSRAEVAIFRDGGFGEKQKDGDGPAEAAPGNAGIVSIERKKKHILHECGAERLRSIPMGDFVLF